MGDASDDITDKDRKASQQSKIQAMEAISEGNTYVPPYMYISKNNVSYVCCFIYYVQKCLFVVQISLMKQLSILQLQFCSILNLLTFMQLEVNLKLFTNIINCEGLNCNSIALLLHIKCLFAV